MRFELDGFDFLNKLGDKFELGDFGKPLLNDWQPVKGKYYPKINADVIPDITTWQTDLLALNQKAYAVLKDTLASLGEFLPVEVESETYYLFNVLTRLADDVIDSEKSEFETHQDEVVGFRTLHFLEQNIPQDFLLFCVKHDYAYNIYCDDRFKQLVTESELSGLYFNPVLIDPYFT